MIAQTTYDWWLVPCELGAFPGIDSESKLYFEGKNYSEPSSEEFEHSEEDLKNAIESATTQIIKICTNPF